MCVQSSSNCYKVVLHSDDTAYVKAGHRYIFGALRDARHWTMLPYQVVLMHSPTVPEHGMSQQMLALCVIKLPFSATPRTDVVSV